MANTINVSPGALLDVLGCLTLAGRRGASDDGWPDGRPHGWKWPWPPPNVRDLRTISEAIAHGLRTIVSSAPPKVTVRDIPALGAHVKALMDDCGSVPRRWPHWPHGPGKILVLAHRLQHLGRSDAEAARLEDLAGWLADGVVHVIGQEQRGDPTIAVTASGVLRAAALVVDHAALVESTQDPMPGVVADLLARFDAVAQGLFSTSDPMPGSKSGPAQITLPAVGLGSLVASTQDPFPCRVARLVATLRVAGLSSAADAFVRDFDDLTCGNVPLRWPFPWPPKALAVLSAIELYRVSADLPGDALRDGCLRDTAALTRAAMAAG